MAQINSEGFRVQNIQLFQVDAFTDKVFHGNPAAVCLLDDWLNDELMQAIAVENNLSETSFIINSSDGFHIRWFSPNGEINLCGHATLAAGFVLFEEGLCHSSRIEFHSPGGNLGVSKQDDIYTLDFPKLGFIDLEKNEMITSLVDKKIIEAYESQYDLMLILNSEQDVASVKVDLNRLSKNKYRGLIVSATAQDYDFYSRCFYPKHHIPEDPVTGSAHCVLAPYWSNKLHKKKLHALQGSVRKGELFCQVHEDRVHLSGYCRWYLKGTLVI